MRLDLIGPVRSAGLGPPSDLQREQLKAVQWRVKRSDIPGLLSTDDVHEIWIAVDEEAVACFDLWVIAGGTLVVLRHGRAEAVGGSYAGLELDPDDPELYEALRRAIGDATARNPDAALAEVPL